MSEDFDFDFAVIGGGSAGYAAAGTATRLGLRTAVIEGGEEVGGLCILRGCMPSKTIIQSANRFLTLRRAPEFGLRAGEISAVPSEIFARKDRLVREFADYRRQQLESGKFAFIRGWASFADAHTLHIAAADGAQTLRARTFLLATGSKSTRLPLPGLAEAGFRDSDDVLRIADLPESVIVLGAGATGLEFAHYHAALGSRVTILQRSGQILKEMDADVAGALAEGMRRQGVNILVNTTIERVERTATGRRVVFKHREETDSVEAAEIIYGLGREPNFDGLHLERAGFGMTGGRINVDVSQQTNVPHIFAAGDAAGPYEIVHIAIQQGEVAARNAARLIEGRGEPLEKTDYRLKLFAIFTEPQVAAVGWTEKELITARVDYRAASYLFADHGKSMVLGETDGFVKLITAASGGEILGGAAVGPSAAELIHEVVVAMHFHATAAEFAKVPHYHPTLSEIWTYPAEELA
jgi:pyruvate/2-oxoglutarate dehydrogenase complex dihydrolipoamide dehydrogenase (E3) component